MAGEKENLPILFSVHPDQKINGSPSSINVILYEYIVQEQWETLFSLSGINRIRHCQSECKINLIDFPAAEKGVFFIAHGRPVRNLHIKITGHSELFFGLGGAE